MTAGIRTSLHRYSFVRDKPADVSVATLFSDGTWQTWHEGTRFAYESVELFGTSPEEIATLGQVLRNKAPMFEGSALTIGTGRCYSDIKSQCLVLEVVMAIEPRPGYLLCERLEEFLKRRAEYVGPLITAEKAILHSFRRRGLGGSGQE